MQDSKETKTFRLNKYKITYPENMSVKSFEESYCYGIIFFVEKMRYELFHNRQTDVDRIYISEKADYNSQARGYWCTRDIPFKPATFSFLPEGVIAEEV
jgi:hypothetical protein